MSIKQKLLLTTIAALVLAVSIVTIIASQVSSASIEKRLNTIELPAVLDAVSAGIENSLIVPITVSRNIAANPRYVRFVQQGEPEQNVDELAAYLGAIKAEYDAITAFFISADSGRYYTDKGVFKTLSADNSRDRWFYKFVSSGKDYKLSLDIDEVTSEATLFINYGVRSGG